MSPIDDWYIITSKRGMDSEGFPTPQILCRDGLEQAKLYADQLGIPEEDQSIIKYNHEE